jgi:CRISPR-associated exonuclease Cas4
MIESWDKIVFTGTQVYYYIIDPKRLWYFSKGITMEHKSDLVEIGRIISRESFKRDKKEIQIGRIKIDFYRKSLEIHEVKKSLKFKDASKWQLIYYLYVLKKLGINCKGVLNFPKEKRIEKIELTPYLERRMEEILKDIERIVKLPKPPKTKQSEKIKKASYWELFMA